MFSKTLVLLDIVSQYLPGMVPLGSWVRDVMLPPKDDRLHPLILMLNPQLCCSFCEKELLPVRQVAYGFKGAAPIEENHECTPVYHTQNGNVNITLYVVGISNLVMIMEGSFCKNMKRREILHQS